MTGGAPCLRGVAWLCPGEASRLCGELQPFPGSPPLREVARLCPGEPPSLREGGGTWTALSRHRGMAEGLASQWEGQCLELKVDSSAGPAGSTEAVGDEEGGTALSEEPICPRVP